MLFFRHLQKIIVLCPLSLALSNGGVALAEKINHFEDQTSHPILDRTTGIIKAVISDPKTKDKMEAIHNETHLTEDELFDRYMAGDFDVTVARKERTDKVAHGARSAVKSKLMHSFSELSYFKEGFSFDFDLANLFGWGSQSSSDNRYPRPYAPRIVYGLKVKGIEPADRRLLTVANTVRNEDLLEAPKSKVEWDIGPLEESTPLYRISSPSDDKDKISLPSMKFKGNITPSSSKAQETLEKGVPSKKPSYKASLFQEEHLYRIEYDSQPAVENDNIRHGVNLPVKGEMKLDREVDKDFEPIKTTLKNVLGASEDFLPPAEVNLHYLHTEARYQSEVGYNRGGLQINLKHTSDGKEENQQEHYEIGLSTHF